VTRPWHFYREREAYIGGAEALALEAFVFLEQVLERERAAYVRGDEALAL
jgi:hypothetical protein